MSKIERNLIDKSEEGGNIKAMKSDNYEIRLPGSHTYSST